MKIEQNDQWRYVRDQLRYACLLLRQYSPRSSAKDLVELIIAIEDSETELRGVAYVSLDENKRRRLGKDESIYRNDVNKFRFKYEKFLKDPAFLQFLFICGTHYLFEEEENG